MTETDYYLDKARTGETDAAYHGLLELPDDAIPALHEAYGAEPDPAVRSLIVRAVWHRRCPSAIEFLATALEEHAPEVWREALDGLVTLASPQSRRTVEQARNAAARRDSDRFAWLAEAIDQIDEALAERP